MEDNEPERQEASALDVSLACLLQGGQLPRCERLYAGVCMAKNRGGSCATGHKNVIPPAIMRVSLEMDLLPSSLQMLPQPWSSQKDPE